MSSENKVSEFENLEESTLAMRVLMTAKYAILRPFQQYFRHTRTMGADNERLCAMKLRLRLKRPPLQAGLETGPLDQ